MATYNLFELQAMSAPIDEYGYRARAAREGRDYETFGAPDEDELAGEDDGAEDEDSDWVPACVEVRRIMDQAATLGEMSDLLKAHQGAQCVACGSTRKTVATDRELVDANAACCEAA